MRRRSEHAASWLPSEAEDPQHPIPSVLDEVKALLASEISKINDTVKFVCDRLGTSDAVLHLVKRHLSDGGLHQLLSRSVNPAVYIRALITVFTFTGKNQGYMLHLERTAV